MFINAKHLTLLRRKARQLHLLIFWSALQSLDNQPIHALSNANSPQFECGGFRLRQTTGSNHDFELHVKIGESVRYALQRNRSYRREKKGRERHTENNNSKTQLTTIKN